MNKQLEKKIDEYRAFWKSPNLSDEDKMKCLNAFTMATKTAYDIIENDGDLKIARMLGGEVKGYIEKYCQEKTNGTIWELEAYGQRKQTTFDIVENYYEILLCEAKTKVFDSYCLYLEKNRPYFERFYLPRRKCFMKIGVTQGLQDLIDDNLDIFMISLPPGTGKALSLDSKVLTPNGYVRMGDIRVGDEVIGGSGKVAKVLGVYPQGVLRTYRVTLDDGSSCEASYDHLWKVKSKLNKLADTYMIIETREVKAHFEQFQIPKFENGETVYHDIKSIDYSRDCECQCIYISDPTHLFVTDDYILTHNTTVEKFFHSAVCGWFPDEYNLFYSHSGSITKMYYDGMLDILTNDVEYTWKIIFPNCTVTSTNATMEQININKYKPFPNVQTTSIGAKTAGRVRASKFLFVDDLIGRIAEALDRNTLDKIWSSYTTDARQRKVMDKDERPCKELILATRWSVSDPIGRLLRVESYKNNPRIRAIAVPCCDKKTGESNFNYDIGGFTKEFFDDLKLTMDEISFKCLYDNEPIEREGILYPANELRRYHSLPVIEPDAVKAACDTKTTGVDYMAMPILRQYGEDYYLVDAVCDNDTHFELQESRIAAKIVNNGVTKTQFENNAGGGRLAENVKRIVERQDYRTEIVSQYTGGRKGAQTVGGKQTRIIVHSDWVKKHVLFPDSDILQNNRELAMFVDFLVTYTIMGDNKFDDVPDSMAQFAEMESRFEVERNYASAVFNPLWF